MPNDDDLSRYEILKRIEKLEDVNNENPYVCYGPGNNCRVWTYCSTWGVNEFVYQGSPMFIIYAFEKEDLPDKDFDSGDQVIIGIYTSVSEAYKTLLDEITIDLDVIKTGEEDAFVKFRESLKKAKSRSPTIFERMVKLGNRLFR